MTHENNNIGGGAEHPGSDGQKISAMLTGLKRVEAPKDFDFHLKAKIANARPADYRRTSLFPILKYAMPLALFLLVGAGIFAVSSYSGWQAPIVQAPENQPDMIVVGLNEADKRAVPNPLQQTPANNSVPQDNTEPFVADNPPPVRKQKDTTPPVEVRRTPGSGGGGSILRTGGNSNQDIRCMPGFPCKEIDAREVLSRLGIDAVLQGENWKVESVKSNGIADQLGVKPGDRLKALDDKPITRSTQFDNQFKVGTITVIRGEETISLSGTKQPE